MGIASLILSIISLASSFFVVGLPIAIIAIVLAAIALNNYEGGAKAVVAILLSVFAIGISQVSLYNIGKTGNVPILANAKTGTSSQTPAVASTQAPITAIQDTTAVSADMAASSNTTDAAASSVSDTQSINLDGNWIEDDASSKDTYQVGFIDGNKMQIFWVNKTDNSTAVYWAGSFDNVQGTPDNCTWKSNNDKSITANAVLASDDDTKDFTYSGGKISYPVSAFGVTVTNNLVRSDNDYKKYAIASSNSANVENTDNNAQSSSDISSQITVNEMVGNKTDLSGHSYTDYFYEITNNSNVNADITVKLVGKNASGDINASSEADDVFIGKGKTGIAEVYLDHTENVTQTQYTVIANPSDYEDASDALSVKDVQNGDSVSVTETNSGNRSISFCKAYVLFMKDGKADSLVERFYSGSNSDALAPGETDTQTFDSTSDSQFNSYKVYLNDNHY